jgi:catechol 2,3-dioxygenase-like lactoylglutathione lyase family enzyme
MSLSDGRVATRIPVQDLARAKAWYSEKLGLDPEEERPGGARYECAGGGFTLFESEGAASGTHTQMAWEVDDFEATIEELKARGVSFDEFGITEVPGHYPSKQARGEKAAWFRDSEGNVFGIGSPAR